MRFLVLLAVVLMCACVERPPVVIATTSPAVTTTTSAPTETASSTPTASPTWAASLVPSASPTPFRTPRPPDPELEAMARTTLDAIALPKVFPWKIQLYEPLGPYHAGFGGFSGGFAILLVGRDDVKSNTVTHEFGHAWHEYFMGYDKQVWAEYGAIRGFTDPIQLVQGANYLDDWRERFANDFQFAFNPDYGGQYAPGPGYWDFQTFQKFTEFVKGLPTRHL